MWQRVAIPRANPVLVNDNVFTGTHTLMCAVRNGVFHKTQFILSILRSCPVFEGCC